MGRVFQDVPGALYHQGVRSETISRFDMVRLGAGVCYRPDNNSGQICKSGSFYSANQLARFARAHTSDNYFKSISTQHALAVSEMSSFLVSMGKTAKCLNCIRFTCTRDSYVNQILSKKMTAKLQTNSCRGIERLANPLSSPEGELLGHSSPSFLKGIIRFDDVMKRCPKIVSIRSGCRILPSNR